MSVAQGFIAQSRKRCALPATALALVVAGLWTTPASADSVRCGDVITENTKLEENLLNCPGNGVGIGAHGVTLDLGGHVIDGDGEGGSGVISYGNDDVQIRNGTVREFATGVDLTRSPAPTAAASRAPSNHLISKMTVVDNASSGVNILDGYLNVVQRNTIARNGGWGMAIMGGARNTLVSNTLARNHSGGLLLATGTRLNSTVENLVRKNDVIANHGSGIVLGGSLTAPFFIRDNRIEKNDVIANERDGIWLASGGGSIEGNQTDRNGDDGIDADCRYRADDPQACAPEIALSRNKANRNGDLGIEADAGVSDGGRNTARDNGNPAQCVGVACS